MAEQITFLFGYALTQLKNAKGETIRVKDQDYRKKAFEEILVTWPDVCDVRFWYDSHSSQVHMRRLVLFLSPLWLEKVDILYGWIKHSCDFWRDKAQGMFFFFFCSILKSGVPSGQSGNAGIDGYCISEFQSLHGTVVVLFVDLSAWNYFGCWTIQTCSSQTDRGMFGWARFFKCLNLAQMETSMIEKRGGQEQRWD